MQRFHLLCILLAVLLPLRCRRIETTGFAAQQTILGLINLELQKSDEGQDDRVAYGVSAMQGWRISMEDAHAAVLDLQVEDPTKDFQAASTEDRLSFFGVYDGHGGDKVALYAGEHIHKILAKQEAFRSGDFEQALKDGFLATDRAILNGNS